MTGADEFKAFVVIPDAREFPAGGSIHWSNGFLPAKHQGVVVRAILLARPITQDLQWFA